MNKPLNVSLVGSGMYVTEVILPSLYQLQREKFVGKIGVSSLHIKNVDKLSNNLLLKEAFPGQTIDKYITTKNSFLSLEPKQLVIVAIPDHLHYDIIIEALNANQNVFCVKPLVLSYPQALEIKILAAKKGLWVGVDYHKRFDHRSLLAKKYYEKGDFGKFIIGEAHLVEPYYYRESNFKKWFTAENSDPFTYIGCHYVDLVSFITNLSPMEVSVNGIESKFSNGKKTYLWSQANVTFENGAILSLINGMGYPNDAPGSNSQGLMMFFEGSNGNGMLRHEDQHRGVSYSFLQEKSDASKVFHSVNPDFFQLVPWEGNGYKPVGYGFDSIANAVKTVSEKIIDNDIAATIHNSLEDILVTEAGRMSIENNGMPVRILNGNNNSKKLAFKWQYQN